MNSTFQKSQSIYLKSKLGNLGRQSWKDFNLIKQIDMLFEKFYYNSAASHVLKLQTNFYYRICGMQVTILGFSNSVKIAQFKLEIKAIIGTWRPTEMVFCYQNCSDLLWEKIVLVIEKNFWNSRLKAKNLQKFWDH